MLNLPALSKYNYTSMTEETLDYQAEETTSENTESGDVNTETLLPGQEEGESLEEFAQRVIDEKTDLEAKNKRLYERAKKTPRAESKDNSKQVDDGLIEYIASPKKKEEYELLKSIMDVKGLTMEDAKKDVLFKTHLQSVAQEEKSQKAKLGASGGSPGVERVNTSEMSPEEHQAYAKQVIEKAL